VKSVRARTASSPAVASDATVTQQEDDSETPAPRVDQPRRGLPSLRLPKVRERLTAAGSALRASVPRSGGDLRRIAWLPVGIVIAAGVLLVFVLSGAVESIDVALVAMGFDPDRAQLITALIVAGVVAAAVTGGVNRGGFGTLLGAAALGAVFAQTFVTETQNARASTGATGIFDPSGWLLTLVTLAVVGVGAAWIGATVASAVRPAVIGAGASIWTLARNRRLQFSLIRRPVGALLVLVLLVVSLPAFSDMVNFTPDVLMLRGDQQQGLIPGASVPSIGSVVPATRTPAAGSGSPSAVETSSVTVAPMITAAPGTKPWLAWKPSGAGRFQAVSLPAPWAGGDRAEISVYTPPGYDSSSIAYPVLYEAPTVLSLWGTSVATTLNYEIDTGAMPAAIVVFISDGGAPYVPSECIDTFNGTQSFETYIAKTVVQYIDGHYRTIQDARARGTMGFSEGGFCAAMLALRNSDVFNTSISFSGYYVAASSGSNSRRPYRDQADMDAHSPGLLAQQLPVEDRSKMYFIVVARQDTDFMGAQASYFAKVLKAGGYSHMAVNSTWPHGWTQVRYETPVVLVAWGAQLVRSGIW
jgi:enterochelin esterase-like enzyme